MRTLGEADYHTLLVSVMRRSTLAKALIFNCLPAVFYIFLGAVIHFVDSDPMTRGYYLGTGILAYGFAILVFYPWRFYRVSIASRTAQ